MKKGSKVHTLEAGPGAEIMDLRNRCGSTTPKGEKGADKSGALSRGQVFTQIAALCTWAMVVTVSKAVTGKLAKAFTDAGVTVKGSTLTYTGAGFIPEPIRKAFAGLQAVDIHPVNASTTWALGPLGYTGVRNLGAYLSASTAVNLALGISHNLTPAQCAMLDSARTLPEVGKGKTVPHSVTFTAAVPNAAEMIAVHRAQISYVGRAGFARTPGKLNRSEDLDSLRKQLNGSQGWLRIFKNDTIKGDGISRLALYDRVGRHFSSKPAPKAEVKPTK